MDWLLWFGLFLQVFCCWALVARKRAHRLDSDAICYSLFAMYVALQLGYIGRNTHLVIFATQIGIAAAFVAVVAVLLIRKWMASRDIARSEH